jgi:hypothetical protein
VRELPPRRPEGRGSRWLLFGAACSGDIQT